jgi:adenylyltransferase/sulfurtransferase
VTSDRRHHRQQLLPFVGEQGQRRLRDCHALLVGMGALGCVAADHLARAGVGTLTLVDRDVVELTNLQRQSLYTQRDAEEGLPKVEAARRRLLDLDGSLAIHARAVDCSARTARSLLDAAPAVILDGTDNYETRYLLNDLAIETGTPLVYGGAVSTRAMQMTVLPGESPCIRCVFPEPPPARSRETCDTVGVLGPAVGVAGSLMAAEAMKILLGRSDLVRRSLARVDVLTGEMTTTDLRYARDLDCPCCAHRRFDWLDGDRADSAVTLCGRSSVQITPAAGAVVDLNTIHARLANHGDFRVTPFLVKGSLREGGVELSVFPDGRAIISTPDTARARAIYAKYLGA